MEGEIRDPEKEKSFKLGCAKAMAVLVLGVPLALWCGFVVSKLWGWFVAETFGVQRIGVLEAVGLDLLVTLLIISGARDRAKDDAAVVLSNAVFAPAAAALLFGFVIHSLM